MYKSDNDEMIRALAFEKVVLEVLKKYNPNLKENYYDYDNICRNYIKENNVKKCVHLYDGFIENELDLNEFDCGIVRANEIIIEIKLKCPANEVIERFIRNVKTEYNAIVFILATSENKVNVSKFDDSQIKFVFLNDLVKCKDIKNIVFDCNDYLNKEDNLLNFDDYQLLNTIDKSNLSFALGAGCSKNSHISDWNVLSDALGYELLHKIIGIQSPEYKCKTVAEELNKQMFSCFDKSSVLDALYNNYMKVSSCGNREYWELIKDVLYMNYDNPFDAKQPLMNSIVRCIKKNKIFEVLNYNFDSVLEQNYNLSYKSNANEIETSVTHIGNCKIYHVHGFVPFDYDGKSDINNFIFTDKEYYDNANTDDSFCNISQRNILFKKNVIFVGVSFTDSNMKEILRERMKKNINSNKIFAFLKLPNFDYDGLNKRLMENKYKLIQQSYFDTLGVKILWVNDFSEIPQRIDNI